jgi:hypothetical protein
MGKEALQLYHHSYGQSRGQDHCVTLGKFLPLWILPFCPLSWAPLSPESLKSAIQLTMALGSLDIPASDPTCSQGMVSPGPQLPPGPWEGQM